MSEYVDSFIKDHREYFLRNKNIIYTNTWNDIESYNKNINSFAEQLNSIQNSKDKDKEKKIKEIESTLKKYLDTSSKGKKALFKQENKLTNSILGRLTDFINETEKNGDRKQEKEKTQRFIDETVDIINIHLKKCSDYLKYGSDIINKEAKTEDEIEYNDLEIDFQDDIFIKKVEIQNTLKKVNITGDISNTTIEFHEKKKASFVLREPVCLLREDVKEITDRIPVNWDVRTSKEMFINMRPQDIPKWNKDKHYFYQTSEVLQFWAEEYNKIIYGLNIGGFYMHGWLYFHLNFFRTPIPQSDGREPNIQPPLRDNEWFFAENLKKCESKEYPAFYSKAMLVYGTRRFGKSVILASLAHWRTIAKFNSFGSIIGGNSSDLNALTSKIKTSMTYIDAPLRMPILKQEWDNGETTFGIKNDASNPIIFSTLIVQNLEQGTAKKSQKTAGLAPSVSIYDEIGKYDFLKPYLAALPSFKTPYGFKCVTALAGCVCAGTKVWDTYGNLTNIEDLKPENGIIGFNVESYENSKEVITYWQEPHEKPCYRIETTFGRFLECSEDHPIYTDLGRSSVDYRFGRLNGFRKMEFKEAKDVKKGDRIAVIEELNIFGDKEMWNPRLVGLLIGDGSYGYDKTPILSNCDKDVNEYVYSNFDAVFESGYKTKDGRDYKETRIRKICPELRKLGIYGQTKMKKTLPLGVHSYKKEDICEMIGGFFDADGCVSNTGKNNYITISSMSDSLMLELKLLLQKLGIHGNISKKEPSKNNPRDKNPYYVLGIYDKKSINIFHKNIKFLIKYKQENLNNVVEHLKNKNEKIQKNFKGLRLEKVKSVEYIGNKPVYNLTAGTTHTYVANGILTHNTGGEASLSKDAMKVLSSPETYDLLPMDWDLLQTNIDPEHITWKKRNFATFFPGQMAYEDGFIKERIPLSDFMGNSIEGLKDINIDVTNWERNTKYLEQKIKEAQDSPDSNLLVQQRRVQYPTDPEHCFLSAEKNPFCYEDAVRHKEYLELSGLWDRRRKLYKNSEGKIKSEMSSIPLVDYPFTGGNVDAPFLIFEDIPEERPPMYCYVAGLDDYKQVTSNTDSVGTIYIYKYDIFGDEFAKKLVASYSGRPGKHKDFHKNCLLLLDAYNASCFMENEDTGFIEFLEELHLEDKYLMKAVDFTSSLNITNNAPRKFGWSPKQSKTKLLNMFVNYCNADIPSINEEGEEITIKGITRINDIHLLNEIINFKDGGNFDRISASLGAIGWLHYLETNYISPISNHNNKEVVEHKKPHVKRIFGGNRGRGILR